MFTKFIKRKEYLEAKRIVEEYELNPYFHSKNANALPKYIIVAGVEMRYDSEEDCYYRDAGNWSLGYKITKDGKLVSDEPFVPWLNEQEMIEISEKDWREANKGYIS
jgi:hypothetical protein